MSDTILAVDLGRHKSVACVYDRRTREHAFRTLDTTPAEFDALLARHPGALVVVEACANAGWVHDRAVAAGHTVKVANTAAEAWKFTHLKRKTDRDDARRLAELEAVGQLARASVRNRKILAPLVADDFGPQATSGPKVSGRVRADPGSAAGC